MAKKKSKKKIQSPGDILERAEKLFKKKSYQAALREYGKFEKINKNEIPVTNTVAEHMAVCRRETALIRAGELVKKARRLQQKGNTDQAIQVFKQAYDLTGDKQLADTIAALQATSDNKDLLASADQAEAAGEYATAAEILDRLYGVRPENSLLCRRARCLIKAGQWQQAAAAYGDADCTETEDLYKYGFALLREQKYLECLNIWEKIQSEHPDFTKQKETVLTLLLRKTEAILDEDPIGCADDIRLQIESLPAHDHSPAAIQLLSRCRSLQLVKLWQEKRMEEIGEMSETTDSLNLTVLGIYARAAYIHVEAGGTLVSVATVQKFIDFWLSALFNPVSGDVPKALFDSGLKLVKRYGGYHPGVYEQLSKQWEDSFDLLTILDTLRASGKIDKSIPLFTPALALQAGICEDILVVIRKNENAFPDKASFLTAGANYSRGAASLLMARNSNYEGAFKSLDQFNREKDDPFLAHACEHVRFACGLHALSLKDYKKAESLLVDAAPLLRQHDELQEQLLSVLDIEDDWDTARLTVCLNILSALKKSIPSREIDKALCRVMTRRAVELYNSNKMNVRVLVKSLEKAATFDPEDEFTGLQLNDARRNLEQSKLAGFIDRFKLSAATNLAAKSQYPAVREMFFAFLEQICKEARNQNEGQPDAKLILFRKFFKAAASVDPLHPVTAMLEHEIAQKEMGNEPL